MGMQAGSLTQAYVTGKRDSTINKTNNAAIGLDFSQGMVLSPPPDQQHREKALVSPSNPAAAAAQRQLWLGKQEEMILQGHPDSNSARQALTFFSSHLTR